MSAAAMSADQAPAECFDASAPIDLSIVDEKRSSMLYNVLPAMVQNRIPMLPSIRRALCEIRSPSRPLSPSQNASEASLPSSPPPGYTSRPTSVVDSQFSSSRTSFDTVEEDDLFQEAAELPLATLSTPPPFTVSETKTGIKWKYANQGQSCFVPFECTAANTSKASVSPPKPTQSHKPTASNKPPSSSPAKCTSTV